MVLGTKGLENTTDEYSEYISRVFCTNKSGYVDYLSVVRHHIDSCSCSFLDLAGLGAFRFVFLNVLKMNNVDFKEVHDLSLNCGYRRLNHGVYFEASEEDEFYKADDLVVEFLSELEKCLEPRLSDVFYFNILNLRENCSMKFVKESCDEFLSFLNSFQEFLNEGSKLDCNKDGNYCCVDLVSSSSLICNKEFSQRVQYDSRLVDSIVAFLDSDFVKSRYEVRISGDLGHGIITLKNRAREFYGVIILLDKVNSGIQIISDEDSTGINILLEGIIRLGKESRNKVCHLFSNFEKCSIDSIFRLVLESYTNLNVKKFDIRSSSKNGEGENFIELFYKGRSLYNCSFSIDYYLRKTLGIESIYFYSLFDFCRNYQIKSKSTLVVCGIGDINFNGVYSIKEISSESFSKLPESLGFNRVITNKSEELLEKVFKSCTLEHLDNSQLIEPEIGEKFIVINKTNIKGKLKFSIKLCERIE